MNEEKSEYQPVPCGKCPSCAKARASGWSFRLVKQGEVSTSALFITLTYDSKYVPFQYLNKDGELITAFKPTLNKEHLQLFFKRLRYYQGENDKNLSVKYYAVGEYGGKTWRPHYHIILFNADAEHVCKAWDMGHVHIGQVTDASIGYTLKYITKKGKIPQHKNDNRQKEFCLMSKGLGKNYLTENIIQWHKSDLQNRMYLPLKDGKKAAMPRYYKQKLYSEQERQLIQENLVPKIKEQELKEMAKYGNEYQRIKDDMIIQKYKKMHINSEKTDSL